MPLFLTLDILKEKEEELSGEGASDQTSHPQPLEETQPSTSQEPRRLTELVTNLAPPQNAKAEAVSEPETSIKVTSKLPSKKPAAYEYDSDINILKDVTGQSTSEGSISDFNKYCQTRFEGLRRILHNQRREVMGATEIANVWKHQGQIKFVGLIYEVHETKNGHKIIQLEDESDSISVLINNTSPLINMTFVPDEVICVIGKMGKSDLVYVEDIIRPDVPIARKQNRSEVPVNCIFMSDIHIGSNTFLHDAWDRFVKWLNGNYMINGTNGQLDRLKYIVVAGDVVDGIGIYPNQESELEIKDIYAQYENLAAKFQDIPEHIQIIIQPGNHDAVRPAEPQPTFPQEITQLFSDNVTFIGNPSYFTLNGVEILAYHGRSMDDFVMQIPKITYNQPIEIMKEMLSRRHLAPVYGNKTPIAFEHQDYLLIENIPDIFVTGHIHKTALENYRDITLINASAWQSQTQYQKMMNFNPDPGKIIMADLQTRKVNILNFA
jgi:DNA polymerase II small subunit